MSIDGVLVPSHGQAWAWLVVANNQQIVTTVHRPPDVKTVTGRTTIFFFNFHLTKQMFEWRIRVATFLCFEYCLKRSCLAHPQSKVMTVQKNAATILKRLRDSRTPKITWKRGRRSFQASFFARFFAQFEQNSILTKNTQNFKAGYLQTKILSTFLTWFCSNFS